MEKILPSIYETFDPVRLKKSDVAGIAGILSEQDGVSVAIETDTSRFESLAEFLAFEEPIKVIRIRSLGASTPMTIRITAWSVSLSAPAADTIAFGILARVTPVVRRRRVLVTPMRLVNGLLAAVGVSGAIVSLSLKGRHIAVSAPLAVAIFVVIGVAAGFGGVALGRLLIGLREAPIRFRQEKLKPIEVRAVSWELFKLFAAGVIGGLVQWLRTR